MNLSLKTKAKTIETKIKTLIDHKYPGYSHKVYGMGYGGGASIKVELTNTPPHIFSDLKNALFERFWVNDQHLVTDETVAHLDVNLFFSECHFDRCYSMIETHIQNNKDLADIHIGQVCDAVLKGEDPRFINVTHKFWGVQSNSDEPVNPNPQTLVDMLEYMLKCQNELFHRICTLSFVEGAVFEPDHDTGSVTVLGDIEVGYNHKGYELRFEVPVFLYFKFDKTVKVTLAYDYRDIEDLETSYQGLFQFGDIDFVSHKTLESIDSVVDQYFSVERVLCWQDKLLASYDFSHLQESLA